MVCEIKFGAKNLACVQSCVRLKFWGAGVVTTSKPPSPYEQLFPLPTPCIKMFLERSLNEPHLPPSHFKHLSQLRLQLASLYTFSLQAGQIEMLFQLS